MRNIINPIIAVCFLFIPLISFSQQSLHLKEGIDTLSTINSFKPEGEFYTLDYSGDYNQLLNEIDDMMTGGKFHDSFDPFKCSLFSANGNEDYQIFGRNFDNPNNDVLITRFSPPDGFQSMAFTRMTDMGFNVGINYNNLCFDQKLPLLLSAYFVPDGINEYGLSCGLATVESVQITVYPEKDTIFITRLIREILDHAQTIEEALVIANSFNVFDINVNTLSHHLLVGTPQGESLVLEYSNGEFQAVETPHDWQVLTNIPVWNVSHQELMNSCWRYNSLFTELENNSGELDWDEGMSALQAVHLNCPWSAIYDMTNRGIYIAVHNNYNDIAFVDLETFMFNIYVDIPMNLSQKDEKFISIFPNPAMGNAIIEFNVKTATHISLVIYDSKGRKVKELLNEEKDSGMHSVNWDTKNEQGNTANPGSYYCQLTYGANSESIPFLLIE